MPRVATSVVTSVVGNACLWLGAALSCTGAAAQSERGTLLTGQDVTEANVLQALVPADSHAADNQIRTRAIRPTLRPSPAEAIFKPKKASASLLITFETNSTELTGRSKEQLDVVAAALKNDRLKDFAFEVEGHADARGTHAGNLDLSQRRAEVTRRYLVVEQGIAEARLRAIGKGDAEPMNTQDIAAAENRRVAITTVLRQ